MQFVLVLLLLAASADRAHAEMSESPLKEAIAEAQWIGGDAADYEECGLGSNKLKAAILDHFGTACGASPHQLGEMTKAFETARGTRAAYLESHRLTCRSSKAEAQRSFDDLVARVTAKLRAETC